MVREKPQSSGDILRTVYATARAKSIVKSQKRPSTKAISRMMSATGTEQTTTKVVHVATKVVLRTAGVMVGA
jgi:hypothetical protein